MLQYYYVEEWDLLYVYDYDSGFYKSFDRINKKWVTPVNSFMQVEHDYDTDFVEISEEVAMKISNGVGVDEEFKAHLAMLGKVYKR